VIKVLRHLVNQISCSKTAGSQSLILTNSGYNVFDSKNVTVVASGVNGFISFVSVKTAQAGVASMPRLVQ